MKIGGNSEYLYIYINNFCVFATEIFFVPFEACNKYIFYPYVRLNRGSSK